MLAELVGNDKGRDQGIASSFFSIMSLALSLLSQSYLISPCHAHLPISSYYSVTGYWVCLCPSPFSSQSFPFPQCHRSVFGSNTRAWIDLWCFGDICRCFCRWLFTRHFHLIDERAQSKRDERGWNSGPLKGKNSLCTVYDFFLLSIKIWCLKIF